ncbi:MAG: hypothetical protein WCT49_04120 [Candidatus Paceibacterota bacterium]|jgi:hypothetical protein|nr:hypothetical protein [Candidatus Paceibacterota bacterium]
MENNDPFRKIDGQEDDKSHLIENLEKKLYSRQDEIQHRDRTVLRPKKINAEGREVWEEGGSLRYQKTNEKESSSPFVKFFLFSLIFFIIAVGIAAFSFFSKRIVVSPNNVNVSVFGPVSAKGGEEIAIQVQIENKNTVPLNSVQITANFPDGSRYISNPGEELPRTIKKIGTVDAGEERTETIKALIFGGQNERKEINFEVRFSIEGSGAQYTKNKKFMVGLTAAPLSFTTSLLREITPKQEFTLGVDIKSNSPTPIKDPLFKIDYPQGFIFKGAVPAPVKGDSLWSLGDMNFGDTRHLEVRGSLLGESEQQKIFRLTTGAGTEKDFLVMKDIFATAQTGITIKKSFLSMDIFVNGVNSESPVLNEWRPADIGIHWTNSLPDKVNDGEISVSVTGDVIDKKTVFADSEGFYDSISDVITWDKRAIKDLASLAPGKVGTVSFRFSLLPYSAKNAFKNPTISVSTSVKGKRVDENNVPEDVKFSAAKTIKLSTLAKLVSYGTYYGDPIPNTGPIPPRVGQETTYTITWKALNTVNDLKNAEVSAAIPLSVRWTGKVFPTGSPISYDQTSKKVTWKIGKIKSGVGYLEEPAQVSFQVVLLPGLSQLYKSPTLLSAATFTATDDFTGAALTSVAEAVSTTISSTDPRITLTDTQVAE